MHQVKAKVKAFNSLNLWKLQERGSGCRSKINKHSKSSKVIVEGESKCEGFNVFGPINDQKKD